MPLVHGAYAPLYNMRRTPARCALSPNVARVGAATLIAVGAALRLHGQQVVGRLFGLTGIAVTSVILLRGAHPSTATATVPPTSRFSGSRAAWDSSEEDDLRTAAPTSGFIGGLMNAARILTGVLIPLLDALRVLVADMRTRRRSNDPYFRPPPPRPPPSSSSSQSSSRGSTTWTWEPPTSSGKNRKGLSMEEEQLQAIGETARRAAKSARGGAQKARDALRNLLNGFT